MISAGRYLFGPVAAIRPYLLARLFLLLLAADIWIDFLVGGARYGVGGVDVAHFAWLDALQPVPTPAFYIVIMLTASFAMWLCALGGLHRGLLGLALVLFTYGWAMSQLDSYQHHYLLSLMLLCVACMPKLTTAQIAAEPRRPVCAWGYVMLGVQIAIVYLWTAIAKMDSAWIGGHTVRRLLQGDHVAAAAPARAESTALWALSTTNAWPIFAVGAIVMEMLLVAGYLYAVGQDRRADGRAGRRLCAGFWLIAVMLHAGILMMGLTIGLFSIYMLLAACAFLLPLEWLEKIGALALRPAMMFDRARSRIFGESGGAGACIALALLVIAALVGAGYAVDVPGVATGGMIAGGLLLVTVMWDAAKGAAGIARQRTLAAALFIPMMLGVSFAAKLPYHFYAVAAQANHFAGDPRDAARFYRLAIAHAPGTPDDSQLYNNFGDTLQQLNRLDEAEANYRASIRLNPADYFAHSNLAKLLVQTGKYDEAVREFGQAVEAKPDDAVMLRDLAGALGSLGKTASAIKLYRVAIRMDASDPMTMNGLAWILATGKERTPQETHEALDLAKRAAALTQNRDPIILTTLAESHFAAGDPKRAVAVIEQAIQLARDRKLDAVAAKLGARLDRYKQAGGN